MSSEPIASKVWSFCINLRVDGAGYGEQAVAATLQSR
jgi:hypothetical protein